MNFDLATVSLADKILALRVPSAYPHTCSTVEYVETHFACVFLTEEFAYKLKKPVCVERMDFRDLQRREQSCREELRLNRRLAPQVYLDVVPLAVDADGQMHLGDGMLVDWLVKMRRLPAARMLDQTIAAGSIDVAEIRPAAGLLARFYREAAPIAFSGSDYLARMRDRVNDVRNQLRAEDLGLEAQPIEAACRRQQAFLQEHAVLIEQRAVAGRIVEGHGDLRPEHMFLGNQDLAPAVIDCLEFDRDLRIYDPVEELAFLALECERLGNAAVGQVFLDIYEFTASDNFAPALFAFYRAQRALTRAKIAAWHLRDPEVRELDDWRALSRSYTEAALA